MERTIYPEWRAQNGTTQYPFSANATLVNDDGDRLLDGIFLDAILYPIGGGEGLYLSSVTLTHESISLTIGNVAQPILCGGTIDLVDPPDSIKLLDLYGRPAGLIVSERIRFAILQSLGIGTFEFAREQTEFCASCCIPTPEIGVRGIELEDGTVMVGDVWLVGDDGVVLRTADLDEPDACGVSLANLQAIRIDVIGDPLYRRRLCTSNSLFGSPKFIKTIRVIGPNGTFDCGPDEFGELKLTVLSASAPDTVLRISPSGQGIGIGAVGQQLKE